MDTQTPPPRLFLQWCGADPSLSTHCADRTSNDDYEYILVTQPFEGHGREEALANLQAEGFSRAEARNILRARRVADNAAKDREIEKLKGDLAEVDAALFGSPLNYTPNRKLALETHARLAMEAVTARDQLHARVAELEDALETLVLMIKGSPDARGVEFSPLSAVGRAEAALAKGEAKP